MTTYHELTGFQRDLLEAIAAVEDDPYGLALKDYLDERYPDPINHSRLYQNLDALTEQGLVNRDALDDRTNAYTLTDAGKRLLQRRAETLAGLCELPRPAADGGTVQVPAPGWVVFDPDDATVVAMVTGDETITQSGEGWWLELTALAMDECASGWAGDGTEPEPPTDVTIQVHPGVANSVLRDPDHADYYGYPEHNVAFQLTGHVDGGGRR